MSKTFLQPLVAILNYGQNDSPKPFRSPGNVIDVIDCNNPLGHIIKVPDGTSQKLETFWTSII